MYSDNGQCMSGPVAKGQFWKQFDHSKTAHSVVMYPGGSSFVPREPESPGPPRPEAPWVDRTVSEFQVVPGQAEKEAKILKRTLLLRDFSINDLFDESYLLHLEDKKGDIVQILSHKESMLQLIDFLLPYKQWPVGVLVNQDFVMNEALEPILRRLLARQRLAEELLSCGVDDMLNTLTSDSCLDRFFSFLDQKLLDRPCVQPFVHVATYLAQARPLTLNAYWLQRKKLPILLRHLYSSDMVDLLVELLKSEQLLARQGLVAFTLTYFHVSDTTWSTDLVKMCNAQTADLESTPENPTFTNTMTLYSNLLKLGPSLKLLPKLLSRGNVRFLLRKMTTCQEDPTYLACLSFLSAALDVLLSNPGTIPPFSESRNLMWNYVRGPAVLCGVPVELRESLPSLVAELLNGRAYFTVLLQPPEEPPLPPIGRKKLAVLRLTDQLLRTRLADSFFLDTTFLETVISLFFLYPNHNLLHQAITAIILSIIQTQNGPLLSHLLKKTQLKRNLFAAFSQPLDAESYRGFLLRIGNALADLSKVGPVFARLLRTEAREWKEFASHLASWNAVNKIVLPPDHPNLASHKEQEDERTRAQEDRIFKVLEVFESL